MKGNDWASKASRDQAEIHLQTIWQIQPRPPCYGRKASPKGTWLTSPSSAAGIVKGRVRVQVDKALHKLNA